MFIIAEYSKKGEELKERAKQLFEEANMDFTESDEDTDIIRLAFAGQYSAGKSSIIKMLTGRSDISVGAGITTQDVHTYEWSGMEVIDTPGIGTGIRYDHDEISYRAFAGADMIVYVVTNELFDSFLAEHFRNLAIEKDKAGEMILVVNKMERTSEGNTKEQQDIIREDLRDVLAPYSPEQLNLCFLDAESYLETDDEDDPEIVNELVERSGFSHFIEILNHFVSEKSLSAKLTTGLYILDEKLEKAIEELRPKSSDADIDALEENYLQQRHVFVDARVRIEQEVKDIFSNAASEVRNLGLESANLIYEGCKKEEVEFELENNVRQSNEIIEKCQQDAALLIETRLTAMGQEIEEMENSVFSRELKMRLSGKFDGLPENVKKMFGAAVPEIQKAGQALVNNTYKAGAEGGLKLANFAGGNVHDIVLKAGKMIGYKFKPWQAVRIAKGVAVGGHILGIVGVGLNVFMQIKEDVDTDRIRIDMRNNRQNIRSQFNSAANELEDFGRGFVQNSIEKSLAEPISDLDNKIRDIRESRSNRSAVCNKMELLQRECQTLIHDIHNM